MIPFLQRFSEVAAKYPERAAAVDHDGARSTTYAQFNDYSSRVAAYLKALGFPKEDLVAIKLEKSMEYVAVELGVMKCGCAFVPISDAMGQERIEHVLKDSGASFVFDSTHWDKAMGCKPLPEAEWADSDEHDLAFIIYTSGSTGMPKGVVEEYGVYRFMAKGTAEEVLEPMGKRLKGVRIDSGDLAYLSKESRKMLDEAGLEDCIIVASNGLDEYTIRSLIHQGAEINSFGVGERLITSASNPVFGAVYKLSAIQKEGKFIPKIKVSETAEKITDPGLKKVYRVYNEEGKAIADYLARADEIIDASKPVRYIDPQKYWKERSFENCTFKNLQVKVFEDGKQVYQCPPVEEIRQYVQHQLKNEIWVEEQRFENPHGHYYDMSPAMYELKMNLLYTLGKAK